MKRISYKNTVPLLVIIVILTLLFFSCNREKNLTFEDWDRDNNNTIEPTEFTDTFMKNYYDDWNSTDNEYLDDEDFHKVTYTLWDTNDDNILSPKEYTVGYKYHDKHMKEDYKFVDVDENDSITYEEYKNSITDNYYADWDTNSDGKINNEELALGVFNNWDTNDDLRLDKVEYKEFDFHYSDI